MNARILKLVQLALCLGLAALFAGCQKKEGATPTAAPTTGGGGGGGGEIVSAEKNSFDEVTAKLNKGGSLYLYLSTEQALSGLSKAMEQWSNTLSSLPMAAAGGKDAIAKGFEVATALVKDSGIEHISGFGASSIAREKGFYYSKVVIHHYAGQNDGFIWSLFGKAPHALKELDLLPESTAFASYSDLDVPLVWKTIQTEVARLHLPEVDKQMAAFPGLFKARTGVGLDDLLGSLGGGYGVILTIDDSKLVTLPIPNNPMEIPEPALAIYAKVKSDVIFNRVDQLLAGNPMVVKSNGAGVKSRTMKIPLPLPIELTPTIARSGDYLFLTSSEGLLKEILDVEAGKRTGFKSTAEFKRLSQGIPLEGNNFSVVSEKLGRTLSKAAQGALSSQTAALGSQAETLRNMLGTNQGAFLFSVGVNGPEGWEGFANGNKSANVMFIPAAVGVVGMISAIAIPNFVRARSTSQENACINNLRMIQGAKQQWALDHNKQSTDTPTMDDLRPYMGRGPKGEFPVCPAGGEYIIGTVGENARCSIPGHVLP
jgi:hypothetical protein